MTPAERAPSLPTFLSDGVEGGKLNVTMLINRHLGELLSKRDRAARGSGKDEQIRGSS